MIHFKHIPSEDYVKYLLDPATAPQGLGKSDGFTYDKYMSFIFDINLMGETYEKPTKFIHMKLHKGSEGCVYFKDSEQEATSYITEDIWNLYYNVFKETRKIIVRRDGSIEIEKEKKKRTL